MWGKQQEDETNQEEDGELENMSVELKQNLGELECEEVIIKDKERFGRVRKSMMNVLRAQHGNEIANRTLNRVNKRMQKGGILFLLTVDKLVNT